MKFEFEEEKDMKINLFFVRDYGVVKLKARNNKGEEKFIMNFEDGKFYRQPSAMMECLKTDREGRIEEEE